MHFHQTLSSWIIQELVAHGIDYFCISPGSRSTPLVTAIASHSKAHSMVHFDERATAFHALGYAKALHKPAVIIATSGTAVGNLLPAVMEAHESHIPLIILTADRPPELQECGANQTTCQHSIFAPFVRWQHTLPPQDPSTPQKFIQTTIAHLIAKCIYHPKGPVHLNCMFREPFSNTLSQLEHLMSPKTTLVPSKKHLEDPSAFVSLLHQAKRGLILIGKNAFSSEEDLENFQNLAHILKWPIFTDILSRYPKVPYAINHYDLLLNAYPHASFSPDCILHFGGAFVSKKISLLLTQQYLETYIHIAPHNTREDPTHSVTHRVCLSTEEFCLSLTPYLENLPHASYYHLLTELEDSIDHLFHLFFQKHVSIMSEPHLFLALSRLDLSGHHLFIANSMPIRDALNFFYPSRPPLCIHANRGLSGIDGNIATAIGIAKALNTPMISILGDQTFLHDCMALAQLKTLDTPTLWIVFNNYGGNIFSHLPIYQNLSICESLFILPHHLDFSAIASLFHLSYQCCTNPETFTEQISSALCSKQHTLVECTLTRESNLFVRQNLIHDLQKHVGCASVR